MPTLYGRDDREDTETIPFFGSAAEAVDLPKYKLNQEPLTPTGASRLIQDELLDEGNARQNLATFCQTYMEPEAVKLMAMTLDKNGIDKSEYPRTAEIENRCVNILADLWHAPKDEKFMGTSTIGSSEACMLAGMALKFRWRDWAQAHNVDPHAKLPNLVISSGYQVCWEKFATYWDIELRQVPMEPGELSLNPAKLDQYLDEYTIGVVGILGITYTGAYDDIAALDHVVDQYNRANDTQINIHVDAASGGMYAPFMQPDIKWDFQLPNVVSINTSGHKYGLVYPGIGWVVWRDEKLVPAKLIFNVSYLGGSMPTMAINFSHSASALIGQYYNFIRLGFAGYKEIHQRTHDVAAYIVAEMQKTDRFEIINDGSGLPVICYKLNADTPKWTLYDLSDRLLMKGWQVPTYPLPADMDQTIIQRMVIRTDFGMNMANDFIEDFKQALADLDSARILFHDDEAPHTYGFTHWI